MFLSNFTHIWNRTLAFGVTSQHINHKATPPPSLFTSVYNRDPHSTSPQIGGPSPPFENKMQYVIGGKIISDRISIFWIPPFKKMLDPSLPYLHICAQTHTFAFHTYPYLFLLYTHDILVMWSAFNPILQIVNVSHLRTVVMVRVFFFFFCFCVSASQHCLCGPSLYTDLNDRMASCSRLARVLLLARGLFSRTYSSSDNSLASLCNTFTSLYRPNCCPVTLQLSSLCQPGNLLGNIYLLVSNCYIFI